MGWLQRLFVNFCDVFLVFLCIFSAWRQFACGACFVSSMRDASLLFWDYKETAFGFWRLFLLSQWGIPHRFCRFYCSLRGHQRTETADSTDPAFSILWTPTLPPRSTAAAGHYRWPRWLQRFSTVQIWLAVGVCDSEFFVWHCIFRFSFVLMEDRRCLFGLNRP